MTSQRRERKPCRLSVGFLAILGAAGVVLMVAAAPRSHAAEPVALNPYTGLAIDGFDPVAFFTDGRARPGRPDLELRSGGANWRFANEGNMAAFAAAPEGLCPAIWRSRPGRGGARRSHAGPSRPLADRRRPTLSLLQRGGACGVRPGPGQRDRGRRAALAGHRARHSTVIDDVSRFIPSAVHVLGPKSPKPPARPSLPSGEPRP